MTLTPQQANALTNMAFFLRRMGLVERISAVAVMRRATKCI